MQRMFDLAGMDLSITKNVWFTLCSPSSRCITKISMVPVERGSACCMEQHVTEPVYYRTIQEEDLLKEICTSCGSDIIFHCREYQCVHMLYIASPSIKIQLGPCKNSCEKYLDHPFLESEKE